MGRTSWFRIAVWLPAAFALAVALAPPPGQANCARANSGDAWTLVSAVVLTGIAAGISLWRKGRRLRAGLLAVTAAAAVAVLLVATGVVIWLDKCPA